MTDHLDGAVLPTPEEVPLPTSVEDISCQDIARLAKEPPRR